MFQLTLLMVVVFSLMTGAATIWVYQKRVRLMQHTAAIWDRLARYRRRCREISDTAVEHYLTVKPEVVRGLYDIDRTLGTIEALLGVVESLGSEKRYSSILQAEELLHRLDGQEYQQQPSHSGNFRLNGVALTTWQDDVELLLDTINSVSSETLMESQRRRAQYALGSHFIRGE